MFKISKCTFFQYLKKLISKKLFQVFLRFASILFLIFEQGEKQNIGPGFFLRFVSRPFLIFEKTEKQGIGKIFLRLASIFFFNI